MSDEGEMHFSKEIGFFNPSSSVKKYLSDSVPVHRRVPGYSVPQQEDRHRPEKMSD